MNKLLSICVVFAIVLQLTDAYDFGCQKIWSGPSADNSVTDCFTSAERTTNNAGKIVPPAFMLLTFLVVLIGYPLFFCVRQCCDGCGSNKMRPGASCCGGKEWDPVPDEVKMRYYPRPYLRSIKIGAFIVFALSVIILIIIVTGAAELESAQSSFFLKVKDDVLDYFSGVSLSIRNDLTLADGNLIPPLTDDIFTNIDNAIVDAETFRQDRKDDVAMHMDKIRIAVNCLAVIPFIFLFFTVACAAFDIRVCIPATFTCFYYIFFIVYALIAVIFLTLGVVFLDFCGEITLHKQRQPGILQWYVIPYCESKANFDKTRNDLGETIVNNSALACSEMSAFCDPADTYSFTNPSKMFVCPLTSYNVGSQCKTLLDVTNLVKNSEAKTGSPACTNCTIYTCPDECLFADLRNTTGEVVTALDYATRGTQAFERVVPLLDCNSLLDRLVLPFSECSKFHNGFLMVGSAGSFGAWLFIFGIAIMFKGQKVFFKPPERKNVEEREPSSTSKGMKKKKNEPI